MKSLLLVLLYNCSLFHNGLTLQVTSTPPLLDVPTYSLATQDANGKTGMNILTYATPVSIRPDRIWSIGLFKGTVAHENFANTKRGVLQLLTVDHAKVVKLLGGSSGRDVDKRIECEKLGLGWTRIIISDSNDDSDDNDDESNPESNQLESSISTEEWPEILPNCACYLKVSLVGELIDCGSHDVALCKVESMLVVGDDGDDNDKDNGNIGYLNTASLREMGIITEQGRVAED
jgi:flavin reductase (DIM6/NTAB) family NADH-FMN oxidoreductase RutF